MKLTSQESEAVKLGIEAAEGVAGAFIPPPYSLVVVAALKMAENFLAQDLDAATVENLRAAAEDHIRDALKAKFG